MFSFIKNILKGTLHKACYTGNVGAVKKHLADGVDVNTRDNAGWTALHESVSHGEEEIVELLIASGAHVNAKDNDGETPLHHALGHGFCGNSPKVASLLIAAGADVNAKSTGGWTPLHYVTEFSCEDLAKCDPQLTVEQLIVKGADVNSMNEDRETPLDLLSSDELKGVTAKIAILLRKHGGKTKKELEAAGN